MARFKYLEDYERLIHRNLESNRPYISQNLNWKDLVIYYNLFTRDEMYRLKMKAKTDEAEVIQQALDMIINNTHIKNRFSALVEALREAEYPKLADILEGKGEIIHTLHRKILKDCSKVIRDMLDPDNILHCLVARDILSGKDAEYIRSKGRTDGRPNAVFEFLQLLPNRNVDWFGTFMEVLKENSYDDLAREIYQEVTDVSPSIGKRHPSILSPKVSDHSRSTDFDTFTKEQKKKVVKELNSFLQREEDITHNEYDGDKKLFELVICVDSCKNRQEFYCIDHKVVFCGQCQENHGELCEVNCLNEMVNAPDNVAEELNEVSLQLKDCIKAHEARTLWLREQAGVCLETISKIKDEISEKLELLKKQREQEVRIRTNLSSSLARYDIKLCEEHLSDVSRISQQCGSSAAATLEGTVANIEAQSMIKTAKKTIERLNGNTKKVKFPVICDALLKSVENESVAFCEVRLYNAKKDFQLIYSRNQTAQSLRVENKNECFENLSQR